MLEEMRKNISIQEHLEKMEKLIGHRQRFGDYSFILGYPLVVSFSVFLLPLYIYMLIFSRLYFWLRNQKQINIKDYYNYDRHQIAHLTLIDRIWCEYCEWANGTLQWTIAFTNEVERRYCPIQNKSNSYSTKVKSWREKFLKYDHTPEDLERYYLEQYPKETTE
jgi:hypothetical protein